MPQDGSHDAPRGPKTAPRRLQMAKELPQEAPKRPKSFQNLRTITALGVLAFSHPMAIRGLRMAPRWPKRDPKALPRIPTAFPEGPKRRPGGAQEAPGGPNRRPEASKRLPRDTQEAPRNSQRHPFPRGIRAGLGIRPTFPRLSPVGGWGRINGMATFSSSGPLPSWRDF
eukprot:7214041-Pyramimonas_sp.AAC.1